MGVFRRLLAGRTAKVSQVAEVVQPRLGDAFLLSGTTHYQAELRRHSLGVHPFRLVRQPDNPHDPEAVAGLIDGKTLVGHISRKMAPRYGRAIAELEATGRPVWVHGTVLKSADGGIIVRLDCPFPEEFV